MATLKQEISTYEQKIANKKASTQNLGKELIVTTKSIKQLRDKI